MLILVPSVLKKVTPLRRSLAIESIIGSFPQPQCLENVIKIKSNNENRNKIRRKSTLDGVTITTVSNIYTLMG